MKRQSKSPSEEVQEIREAIKKYGIVCAWRSATRCRELLLAVDPGSNISLKVIRELAYKGEIFSIPLGNSKTRILIDFVSLLQYNPRNGGRPTPDFSNIAYK